MLREKSNYVHLCDRKSTWISFGSTVGNAAVAGGLLFAAIGVFSTGGIILPIAGTAVFVGKIAAKTYHFYKTRPNRFESKNPFEVLPDLRNKVLNLFAKRPLKNAIALFVQEEVNKIKKEQRLSHKAACEEFFKNFETYFNGNKSIKKNFETIFQQDFIDKYMSRHQAVVEMKEKRFNQNTQDFNSFVDGKTKVITKNNPIKIDLEKDKELIKKYLRIDVDALNTEDKNVIVNKINTRINEFKGMSHQSYLRYMSRLR